MDITAERCEQVISDLQRISVQDAHRCFGCGREHNCSLHGCAIIRDTVAVSPARCEADNDNAE